jgi:Mor family transcriptional regulator
MATKSETWEALTGLADRMREKFGEPTGAAVMRIVVEELGGLRITVPTVTQLMVSERNEKIRRQFTGDNHGELAIMWGISVRQIRRIINERNMD